MKALKHAVQMVWRNRRSYALLSVTVVLTFSFLLGYLLYTDASLYNKHKEVLSYDRKVVFIYGYGSWDDRRDMVLKKAREAGTTYHYKMQSNISIWRYIPMDPERSEVPYYSYAPVCYFIPSQVWGLYDGTAGNPLEVQWLDGQERDAVHLNGNQMLMERTLFELLELDKMDTPVYDLVLGYDGSYRDTDPNDIQSTCVQMEVVGLIDSTSGSSSSKMDDTDQYNAQPQVILPVSLLDQLPDSVRAVWDKERKWYDVYYTDAPEAVFQAAEGMDIGYRLVYKMQDQAITAIQNANRNKAIIAAALFVILGISLYSCFTNALNDRKFEIGVKRAIGASGSSIIGQFLLESIIVMGLDILASVALILDVAVVFKFLTTRIPTLAEKFHPWIIYLSPYSIGMFALCALGLTVGFSLIFAYKSTQVQVVDYLKAE